MEIFPLSHIFAILGMIPWSLSCAAVSRRYTSSEAPNSRVLAKLEILPYFLLFLQALSVVTGMLLKIKGL